MGEEELKVWFINKLSSCYPVVNKFSSYSILYYYDMKYERKLKLSRLNNEELTLPINVSGVCLFYEYSNNFYCDHTEIWKFFEDNYKDDYYAIKFLIRSWLKDIDKFKRLKPIRKHFSGSFSSEEINNLSVLDKKSEIERRKLMYRSNKNRKRIKIDYE